MKKTLPEIKLLLGNRNITVRDVSDKLEEKYHTVFRWLSGEKEIDQFNLVRVSKILCVPHDKLNKILRS